MLTRDAIIEVLKTIEDPELFIDIWFLGLIYSIDIGEDAAVNIEMTFTSPMCPAGPSLIEQVKSKVAAIEGVSSCNVKVTFTPPWEPSEEVKGMLGMI
jgi:metal-sulfur cluster biosynthetic enzyme